VDKYVETLGTVWEIEKNAFKPFPCGIVIHPVIDGCIQLREEIGKKALDVGNIESVSLSVHPLVLELTGKKKPMDGLEGKFSVFHGGAVGLLFGAARPSQYDDKVVTDSSVVVMRDKIDAKADESLAADECFITVKFKDGTVLEKHVDHAVGSLGHPITNEQLTEKFLDQSKRVVGEEGPKRASDACWNLEEVSDMRELTKSL
jgi:aconitate decarboxylase